MDIYEENNYENMKEYWYMKGVEAEDDHWNYKHDSRLCAWEEELDRRDQEEKLPFEEIYLLQRMHQEKELGVLWICRPCNTEYRVRAPFGNLYCSKCLHKLTALRYFPYSNLRVGYWILEEETAV
jgi:hypothetical protein